MHDKWIKKVEEQLDAGRVEICTMDNAKANRKALRLMQVGWLLRGVAASCMQAHSTVCLQYSACQHHQ